MQNFIYNTPTTVYFGKDTHKQVGDIVKNYGYKKVMIQYGKGSVVKSGLLDQIVGLLNQNGIQTVLCGGVEPNPKLSFIRQAVKVAQEQQVDMILAVGGGSSLDSSKFTALGAYNDCDVWDIVNGKVKPTGALPVGVVLTISAAGSEMSSSAVLTDTETSLKKGFTTEFNRCKFAICNPELTYTVSKYQTACGTVDIMSHTIERYFTLCEDVAVTDGIAESILRTVIEAGKTAVENPTDYDARANLMWASSLSHNGLTGCGRENYLAVHQIEHALSGEFDHVAHGAGLAVLFPAWAKYVYKYNLTRFANFFMRVWGVDEGDQASTCEKGIEKMKEYFASIGMPTTLRELNVPKESIPRIADLCTYGQTRAIKNYIPLGYQEIIDVLELCY